MNREPHSKPRASFHSQPAAPGYRARAMSTIPLSDLVFTGFNKRVAALHRDTGSIVWQWKAPSGSSYTTLLLDGDRLIVSVHGYMYALDAATGRQLWQNEMSGFGFGVASITSVRGGTTTHAALIANAAATDQIVTTAAVT